jgi:hypothetical protein
MANSLREDPTSRLPAELLNSIISLALDATDDSLAKLKQKFAFGAVCCRWQQIIWSFPLLWNNWDGSVIQDSYDLIAITSLFELHAKNAGTSPLDIRLLPLQEPSLCALAPLTLLIFGRNAHRIRSLNLCHIDSPMWEAITEFSRQSVFSKLELLTIAFYSYGNPEFPGTLTPWTPSHFPRLAHLWLVDPRYSIYNAFPLHQITTLKLKYIHPERAIVILLDCPNLHQENIISLNSLLMPLISLNMLN